jgi:hypothetical protein
MPRPRHAVAAASIERSAGRSGRAQLEQLETELAARAGDDATQDGATRGGDRPWHCETEEDDERLTRSVAKNIRVHELAKELGMTNAETVDLCGSSACP